MGAAVSQLLLIKTVLVVYK